MATISLGELESKEIRSELWADSGVPTHCSVEKYPVFSDASSFFFFNSIAGVHCDLHLLLVKFH